MTPEVSQEQITVSESECYEITHIREKSGFAAGVLVAISVPIFTAQLKKATVATNQANARSAKAAAVTAYLEEGTHSADLIISYNVATGASATTTVAAGSAIDNNIPSWNASTTGAADATHKFWYVTVGKDSGEVTSISYTDK